MKKFFFWLIFFALGWFFLLHITHAATLAQQLDDSQAITASMTQKLGTGLFGNPLTLSIEMKNATYSNEVFTALLFECPTGADPNGSCNLNWKSSETEVATTTVRAPYTFTFNNTSTVFDPTKYYSFQITCSGFACAQTIYGAASTSSYPNGNLTGTNQNSYFIINGSSSPPVVSLKFPFATAGTTGEPDFQNWVLQWGAIDSTSTHQSLGVMYHQLNSTTTFVDSITFSPYVSADPLPLVKGRLLNPIVNLVTTSSWVATPYYNVDGVTYLGSSVSFDIDPAHGLNNIAQNLYSDLGQPFGLSAPYDNTTSTLNNACQVSTFFAIPYINNLGACISNTAIDVVTWFFVPPNAATQAVSSDLRSFSGVFPFSVVYQLASSTQVALNQNTTTMTFSIPMISSNGQQLVILSSGTLSNYIGSSTRDTVFLYERGGIWLTAGALVLFTVL